VVARLSPGSRGQHARDALLDLAGAVAQRTYSPLNDTGRAIASTVVRTLVLRRINGLQLRHHRQIQRRRNRRSGALVR
jgi:hypothetical protein